MIDIVLYTRLIDSWMIKLIVAVVLLVISEELVDHTALVPQVVTVKIQPNISIVPSRHSFTAKFDSFGLQISGGVYETNNGLLNDQIHNVSYYNKSQSCTFYNSVLNYYPIHDIQIPDGWTIQSSTVLQQNNTIVLLISNQDYSAQDNQVERLFVTYYFDRDNYQIGSNFSVSTIGMATDQTVDIVIAALGSILMATDGFEIVIVNLKDSQSSYPLQFIQSNTTTSIKEDINNGSQILKFQLYHTSDSSYPTQIMLVTTASITIYNVSSHLNQYKTHVQFYPPQGKFYTDAIRDGRNYYALIQGQMVAYRLQKDQSFDTSYIQLESRDCLKLQKYQSTLEIICQQSKLNYVAEFFFNQTFVLASEALKLNRYYNQIDSAKLIFKFGGSYNPKLMISGDQDMLLTAFGINRQVLIDAPSPPPVSRLKGLGLEGMTTIDKFSTDLKTYAVGIGTNFIVLFTINQEPAELECFLQRNQSMIRWNVLVVINTTSCVANGDIEQLSSICSIAIPYTMYVSFFEIDSSRSLLATVLVLVVMAIVVIVLLGCIFKCKAARNRAVQEIRKRLAQLRKKKSKLVKPI